MAFVSNVLVPIITAIVYILFFGGALWMINIMLNKLKPYFWYWLKYKTIKRNKWNKEIIDVVYPVIAENMNETEAKKQALLKFGMKYRPREVEFYYYEMKRRYGM